jgi:hypothetical protein
MYDLLLPDRFLPVISFNINKGGRHENQKHTIYYGALIAYEKDGATWSAVSSYRKDIGIQVKGAYGTYSTAEQFY